MNQTNQQFISAVSNRHKFSGLKRIGLAQANRLPYFQRLTSPRLAYRVHRITASGVQSHTGKNRMNVQINWSSLSNETLEDRRDGKRVSLQFRLEISGTDASGAAFHIRGRTRNVSHHGCCFELSRSILKGEKLTLKVIRHNSQGVQESTGALPFLVAWVVPEENVWVAGAELALVEAPWGITFPEKPAVKA